MKKNHFSGWVLENMEAVVITDANLYYGIFISQEYKNIDWIWPAYL